MLRQSSTILPIRAGGPELQESTERVHAFVEESGVREGIFLFEHRRNAPEREIALHLVGE